MFNPTKVIVDLLLERPFFGTVLSHINIEERNSVETMQTNGSYIYYNAEWSNSLTPSEQLSVFAHEVLHVVFGHHIRAKGRNPILWNIACDMAINPLLKQEGFMLPEGGVFDNQDPPRSAEEIYNELREEIYNKSGMDHVPWGEVSEAKEDDLIEEERLRRIIGHAHLRGQGKISQSLNRVVQDILNPPVLWTDILNNFLYQIIKDRYCFTKFNKRWLRFGIYLPSLHSETLNLVVAVDTSGSVDDEDLSKMVASINDLKAQVRASVRVIYCDSEVCGEEFFDIDDVLNLNPRGGGGTDYQPVFRHLKNEENISGLVYLTDGECNSYPNRNSIDYPVIWVYMKKDSPIEIEVW